MLSTLWSKPMEKQTEVALSLHWWVLLRKRCLVHIGDTSKDKGRTKTKL